MPHQCTNCGRVFDDGSKEMLSGCPDCGGNKFQFQPDSATASTPPDPDAAPPEPPGGDSSVARTVGKTAATVRDIVSGSADPNVGSPQTTQSSTDPTTTADDPDAEDAAQASARSDVVTPDELPSSSSETDDEQLFDPVDTESETPTEQTVDDDAERPDLKELREELNDQFESIKVLEPGQYELNLMELYDREEYIVALQEDGRYSIQVPETIRE